MEETIPFLSIESHAQLEERLGFPWHCFSRIQMLKTRDFFSARIGNTHCCVFT